MPSIIFLDRENAGSGSTEIAVAIASPRSSKTRSSTYPPFIFDLMDVADDEHLGRNNIIGDGLLYGKVR
jgi:hypothetical protein